MSFLSVSIINDAEEIIPECDHDFNMPVLQEQVPGILISNIMIPQKCTDPWHFILHAVSIENIAIAG